MGPNFDLRVSIHPNPGNVFMAVFIDLGLAYLPLNSAKLSCSSEVTLVDSAKLKYTHWTLKPKVFGEN